MVSNYHILDNIKPFENITSNRKRLKRKVRKKKKKKLIVLQGQWDTGQGDVPGHGDALPVHGLIN